MAIFDGLRRAAGLTTDADREEARRKFDSLTHAQDERGAFVRKVVQGFEGAGDDLVRRALPQTGAATSPSRGTPRRISRDPDVRRAQIAQGADHEFSRFVIDSSNFGVGTELGAVVRKTAIDQLTAHPALQQLVPHSSSPSRRASSLATVLHEQGVANAKMVRTYLEAGPASEAAVTRSAQKLAMDDHSADRAVTLKAAAGPSGVAPSDMREAASLALAKARAGVLPPETVVKLALLPSNVLSRVGPEAGLARAWPEPKRIMPNYHIAALTERDPDARQALVDSFRTTPDKPLPTRFVLPAPDVTTAPKEAREKKPQVNAAAIVAISHGLGRG